ncbi:MAG: BrnA antitoxin family protein [Pseudomonadota bacterium]
MTNVRIAISADPNDPEDGDVTVDALEAALEERRVRLRGPQKAATKEQVSIRLDGDLLSYFRNTGPGWQGRVNDALRKVAGL